MVHILDEYNLPREEDIKTQPIKWVKGTNMSFDKLLLMYRRTDKAYDAIQRNIDDLIKMLPDLEHVGFENTDMKADDGDSYTWIYSAEKKLDYWRQSTPYDLLIGQLYDARRELYEALQYYKSLIPKMAADEGYELVEQDGKKVWATKEQAQQLHQRGE